MAGSAEHVDSWLHQRAASMYLPHDSHAVSLQLGVLVCPTIGSHRSIAKKVSHCAPKSSVEDPQTNAEFPTKNRRQNHRCRLSTWPESG